MTILLTEGFDHYTSGYTTLNDYRQLLTSHPRYGVPWTTSTESFLTFTAGNGVNGHPAGRALTSVATNDTVNRFFINFLDTPLRDYCIGFHAIRQTSGVPCNLVAPYNVFASNEGQSNAGYRQLYFDGNGLVLFRSNSSAAVSTGFTMPLNTWTYFELRQTMTGAASGTITVFVNNVQRASGTYSDLYPASGSFQNTTQFVFGKTSTPAGIGACQVSYDNLYISDGERLGPIFITTIRPTADTPTANWTPNTGSAHFSLVNDAVGTDNLISASNVSTSTIGASDLYDFQDLPNTGGWDVLAVTPILHASTSTPAKLASNLKINGTETYSRDSTVYATVGTMIKDVIYPTNPVTNQAWTISDVNNLQMGPKRTG